MLRSGWRPNLKPKHTLTIWWDEKGVKTVVHTYKLNFGICYLMYLDIRVIMCLILQWSGYFTLLLTLLFMLKYLCINACRITPNHTIELFCTVLKKTKKKICFLIALFITLDKSICQLNKCKNVYVSHFQGKFLVCGGERQRVSLYVLNIPVSQRWCIKNILGEFLQTGQKLSTWTYGWPDKRSEVKVSI